MLRPEPGEGGGQTVMREEQLMHKGTTIAKALRQQQAWHLVSLREV